MKQTQKVTTAHKILIAAQDIFILNGFEGSSISDIAQKAEVHKSLIYHYFINKEQLWKAVKEHLFQLYMKIDKSKTYRSDISFKEFLTHIVTLGFRFYDRNPSVARLISWQNLENNEKNFQSLGQERMNNLSEQIIEFQRRGEILKNLDSRMISYFILTTTSMPFVQQPDFFKNENYKNKEKYLSMIIESLYKALT